MDAMESFAGAHFRRLQVQSSIACLIVQNIRKSVVMTRGAVCLESSLQQHLILLLTPSIMAEYTTYHGYSVVLDCSANLRRGGARLMVEMSERVGVRPCEVTDTTCGPRETCG